MAEPAESISPELRSAFFEAGWRYVDWQFGGPEPQVPFRREFFPISVVCGFVIECKNEKLPSDFADVLWRLIGDTRRDLKEDLSKDWSYHAGARCLIGLTNDRNAKYQRQRGAP